MSIFKDLMAIKVVFLTPLMAILSGLGSCKESTNPTNLTGVQLLFNFPIIQIVEGKINLSNLKDSISIFYYDKYVLYKLPPLRRFETDENVPGTEFYFIYNKNHLKGLFFQSQHDTIGIQLSVDSFLFKRGMRGKDFEIPHDSSWNLIQKMNNDTMGFDIYCTRNTGDENNLDSIYCYYRRNMKKVEYSFSRNIDSIKDMKLYKIRMLFNRKYSTIHKLTYPAREIVYEIMEISIKNSKKIISFFERNTKKLEDNKLQNSIKDY